MHVERWRRLKTIVKFYRLNYVSFFIACQSGFVKPVVGNKANMCKKCPPGSQANANRTRCDCSQGYHRYNENDDATQCFNPGKHFGSYLFKGGLIFPKQLIYNLKNKQNEQICVHNKATLSVYLRRVVCTCDCATGSSFLYSLP